MLIKAIQKIESGNYPIDHKKTSATINKTVQDELIDFSKQLAHVGLSKVPYWQIQLGCMKIVKGLMGSNINLRETEYESKLAAKDAIINQKNIEIKNLKFKMADLAIDYTKLQQKLQTLQK